LDEARDEAPPEAVDVVGGSAGGLEALKRPAADLDEVREAHDDVLRFRWGQRREEAEQAAGTLRELLLGRDAETV
jgi:hypothetical protein